MTYTYIKSIESHSLQLNHLISILINYLHMLYFNSKNMTYATFLAFYFLIVWLNQADVFVQAGLINITGWNIMLGLIRLNALSVVSLVNAVSVQKPLFRKVLIIEEKVTLNLNFTIQFAKLEFNVINYKPNNNFF